MSDNHKSKNIFKGLKKSKLPEEGINVFSALLHTHLAGKSFKNEPSMVCHLRSRKSPYLSKETGNTVCLIKLTQ